MGSPPLAMPAVLWIAAQFERSRLTSYCHLICVQDVMNSISRDFLRALMHALTHSSYNRNIQTGKARIPPIDNVLGINRVWTLEF
jgi:hypothetical protein